MRPKEFLKKTYKCLIVFVLLSIFILIAKEVFKKEIFNIDQVIYNFLVEHRNAGLNIFFIAITELGSAGFLIFFTVISIIFVRNKSYKILIPINLAFIALVNQILKRIFVRPRPNMLRLVEENGYSFPSGHAMASTAFYGLLIIYIFRHVKNKKLRNSICIGLSSLIILIDLSRIYVGVHYASDVLAGSSLSISYLIILMKVIKEIRKKIAKKKKSEEIAEVN